MNGHFAIGIHILSLIALHPESARSSDDIAASVGTNAVTIRTVMSLLRKKKLVKTRQGVAGAALVKAPENLTLLEIYRAVGAPESVFNIHDNPHPNCPVGRHIRTTLSRTFLQAQRALEEELGSTTLAEVMHDLSSWVQ